MSNKKIDDFFNELNNFGTYVLGLVSKGGIEYDRILETLKEKNIKIEKQSEGYSTFIIVEMPSGFHIRYSIERGVSIGNVILKTNMDDEYTGFDKYNLKNVKEEIIENMRNGLARLSDFVIKAEKEAKKNIEDNLNDFFKF